MKVILKADVKGSGKRRYYRSLRRFCQKLSLKERLGGNRYGERHQRSDAEKGGGAVPQGRGNQGHAGLGRQAQGPERKRRD